MRHCFVIDRYHSLVRTGTVRRQILYHGLFVECSRPASDLWEQSHRATVTLSVLARWQVAYSRIHRIQYWSIKHWMWCQHLQVETVYAQTHSSMNVGGMRPAGCGYVPQSFLSNQSHKPFDSESSKIFSSRVMTWSSQSQVTRTVETLRVIGLQTRFNVDSNEITHFL